MTIYKAHRKKNGRVYREFKLAYYDQIGKRKFQSFNSLKKARRAANNVNVSLMKGEVKALVLSNDDKVVYLRAIKAVKSIGTALDLAAHQFAEAVKVLFTNYRELVTPEEAKSWFGIAPKVGANDGLGKRAAVGSIRKTNRTGRKSQRKPERGYRAEVGIGGVSVSVRV